MTSASLRLYATSGSSGVVMQAQRNTGAWEASGPNGVTWNTAPAVSSSTNKATSAVPGWHAFTQNLNVRSWVQGAYQNYGVRISAPTALVGETVYFDSSYGAEPPRLVVNYLPATRVGVGDRWSYTHYDHGGGNTSAVNVSSGNVVFRNTIGDAFASGGSGVDLTHTYNSQDPYGQTDLYDRPGAYYGEGWTFSQNLRLYERDPGDAMVFKDGTGADHVYARNADDGATRMYYAPPGYPYTLTKDTKATPTDPLRIYALSANSGEKTYYFDAGGKLTKAENPLDASYLTYGYDAQGRLTSIATSDGAYAPVTLRYDGPGGRLSQIVDMSERTSTFSYDAEGRLRTVTHGAGTLAESATGFNYGVAHHLTSVDLPNGQRHHIGYEIAQPWDTAGSTEGWTADANTSVRQSADAVFRGGGSLRMDLSLPSRSAEGGASRSYSTPVPWGSVQQEVQAFVLWPSTSPRSERLYARLTLEDARGRITFGPDTPLTKGQWVVRMPDAHVDPGYRVRRIGVERHTDPCPAGLSCPAVVLDYGPVYMDHLLVKGTASSYSPSRTVGGFKYLWGEGKTEMMGPDNGATRTTTYTYGKPGNTVAVTFTPQPMCEP